MPIAKNIKYCRKRSNLTQQGFADAIGVTKATVISWEAKKTAVPVPSEKRVAGFFGYSFAEFCDIDIEHLDQQAPGDIKLTRQEMQNIEMFRALPENVKELIRYAIATAYENNLSRGE